MKVTIRWKEATVNKAWDVIGKALIVAWTVFWAGAMNAIAVSVVLPEHAGDWNKLLQLGAFGGLISLANYYRQSPLAPANPPKPPEGGE